MGENRNLILSGVGVLALIGAGVMFFRGSGGSGNIADADPESLKNIRVSCSKCGESWEMPTSEYESLKASRADKDGKVVCPKCGANEMWKSPMAVTLKMPEGVVPESVNLNTAPPADPENPPAAKIKGGGMLKPPEK